jgi:hypothetical protein
LTSQVKIFLRNFQIVLRDGGLTRSRLQIEICAPDVAFNLCVEAFDLRLSLSKRCIGLLNMAFGTAT